MGAAAVSQAPLIKAADAGLLAGLVPVSSPLRRVLEAAGAHYLRPLHVQVAGRAGVGRDTMARALRQRLALTALVPGDGVAADTDLWIYVLAGLPRRADHDAVAELPRGRLIVVQGKADTHGDWAIADEVAAESSRRLGVAVTPVSGLLACADLCDDEYALLRQWAQQGVVMPSMAGELLVGMPGSATYQMRLGLLRRIDQYGIDIALTALARPDSASGPEVLNRTLHAVSGVADLDAPIRAAMDVVRATRLARLRAEIEVAAAGDVDRDAAEGLLSGVPG